MCIFLFEIDTRLKVLGRLVGFGVATIVLLA
jgi:hypothetical protein